MQEMGFFCSPELGLEFLQIVKLIFYGICAQEVNFVAKYTMFWNFYYWKSCDILTM